MSEWTLVESVELSSDSATIDISDIPQTGTNLLIKFSARDSQNTSAHFYYRINVNNSTNFRTVRMDSGATGYYNSNTGEPIHGTLPTDGYTDPQNGNAWSNNMYYITDYTNEISDKTIYFEGITAGVDVGSIPPRITAASIVHLETDAVSSFQFTTTGLFKTGTRVSVYID